MKTNIHFLSVSVLLRLRNISEESCRENQNTDFECSNLFFFFFFNRAVYEIMCKSFVERGRLQLTIWHMRTACWIPKATDTHSEYVIFTTFPLQQWLQEIASLLRYTYIVCLVIFKL
jgi:hypothetical protein